MINFYTLFKHEFIFLPRVFIERFIAKLSKTKIFSLKIGKNYQKLDKSFFFCYTVVVDDWGILITETPWPLATAFRFLNDSVEFYKNIENITFT